MSSALYCTPSMFLQILRHRLKSGVILFYIFETNQKVATLILRYRLKDSCIVSLLHYRFAL
jgi:hypothetical protein